MQGPPGGGGDRLLNCCGGWECRIHNCWKTRQGVGVEKEKGQSFPPTFNVYVGALYVDGISRLHSMGEGAKNRRKAGISCVQKMRGG